jgi:UDP-glucose 4-epimerase
MTSPPARAGEERGHFLVTGGAGFIGSNFVRYLLAREPRITVTVLDKLTYAGNLDNLAGLDPDRLTFVKGDITDSEVVAEAMAGVRAVLNFAAETHVDRSIQNPGSFVLTDVYGSYMLLEAARRAQVEKFVQISTDEVYGEILGAPATEEAPLMPRNPYSASKAGADRLAYSYSRSAGLLLLHDLRNAGRDHAVLEQLRSLPARRKALAPVHHQRSRGQAASCLRHGPEYEGLDLRRGSLRGALSPPLCRRR